MTFGASITKRHRKRRSKSGIVAIQTRYVVNYVDPSTGRRAQLFFERHSDAVTKRNQLLNNVANGIHTRKHVEKTVAQAVEHWLENRRGEVKQGTWRSYKQIAGYVVGPLLAGKAERRKAARKRATPPNGIYLEMLGPRSISSLTTADIRSWHRTVTEHVSAYVANVARKSLRAALALAAEDFHLHIPAMPSQLGRGRPKPKKTILTTDQIAMLVSAALRDSRRGIYYIFPFLTGLRSSEQLALLWDDVDLDASVIRVRRMQEQDCSITAYTKTAAGTREVPICAVLKAMLTRWRDICPVRNDQFLRVFPTLGTGASSLSDGRWKGGKALSYANFRQSYWRPIFASLGLPYVTPHSARHSFISTLQSQGVEVGLVAKLAGHASAAVTLSHYTHAVRGGESALQALQNALMPQSALLGRMPSQGNQLEGYAGGIPVGADQSASGG